jgi:DNA-binding IclR family transcriptional regulator
MNKPSLQSVPELPRIDGDTPTLRLFALLEVISRKSQFFSLQSLVEETGLPKPTLHRMLQQLESAGMLQRENDGRHYGPGLRLRRLAEDLLLNNTIHGARHAVLRKLVEEVGESCNITALSGSEVLYLDRVETPAPLRFYLHPGSRVPAHCSASGKLFLSQMPPSQRRRLLEHAPLEQYTAQTLTDLDALEREIEAIKRNGHAFDNEEFLPGLFCIAMLVPRTGGRSNIGIAIQAPVMRLSPDKALQFLPALQRAANAIAAIDAEANPTARNDA